MTGKVPSIFPIKQDPACLLKWAWSTVYFHSGTSSSCHRTQKYSIDPKNFDTLHNHPEKIIAREKMLRGEWPQAGCQYCKNVEDAGGESDRMLQLRALTDPSYCPPQLLANDQATSVSPTMLEIYFNNTCNMKCVYCGPHFSSLWEQENNKFGIINAHAADRFSVRKSQHNPHYRDMVDSFWRHLSEKDLYKTLRRFHILGGEPFLQDETEICIDFWRDHPNPNLILGTITNLNIPHARFRRYMDKFRDLVNTGKIMTVEIIASLDAWGPQQEYTRFGLNLDLWQENFESIVSEPWVTVGINSVISSLSLKQMPLLLEKINRWNQIRKNYAVDEHNQYIIHSFSYSNLEDNPFYFQYEVFRQDWQKILDLMPIDNQIQKNQKIAMEGIIKKHSLSQNNLEQIQNLKTYLSHLDQRRDTDWKKIFTWLDKEFHV